MSTSVYTLSPYDIGQFWNADGTAVLAGGFVYFYLTGTSTPATTYSDSAGTPHTFPIVLDSNARAVIYLGPGSYKRIVKDANSVQIGPTLDPVTATNTGTSGLGEVFFFGGNSSTPVTATSYPSGATYDKLVNGTTVWIVDSANLSGTYVLTATGMVTSAVTMTVALVNLSDGAPDTPIATCAITSLTGQVVSSSSVTFGAPGTNKSYAIKAKMSSGTGFPWGISMTKTA